MTETGTYRFGDTTIEYQVIRSARRKKTIEITLDPLAGVQVAAPMFATKHKIHDVIRKRAGWIVRKGSSADLSPRRPQFVSGQSFPYLGRQVRMYVESADGRRPSVRFDHWQFRVAVPIGLTPAARQSSVRAELTKWYRKRASERLPARVKRWSAVVGHQPSKVLIRDQRQRWASCGPDGTLRFNWRAVMAEPALIDYVVIHEMIHLGVRTHSAEFWREIARVMPDYRLRRQRLKEVGQYLSL